MSREPTVNQVLRRVSFGDVQLTCVLCLLPYVVGFGCSLARTFGSHTPRAALPCSFDYPTLFRLLSQLGKAAGVRVWSPTSNLLDSVTREWTAEFTAYVERVPVYYLQPLRQALGPLNLASLVPRLRGESVGYNRSLRAQLKHTRTLASAELQRMQRDVAESEGMAAAGVTRPMASWLPPVTPGESKRIAAAADSDVCAEAGSWAGLRARLRDVASIGGAASTPLHAGLSLGALAAGAFSSDAIAGAVGASDGEWEGPGGLDDDAKSVASTASIESTLSWRVAYDEEGVGGAHRVPIAEMGDYSTVGVRGACVATSFVVRPMTMHCCSALVVVWVQLMDAQLSRKPRTPWTESGVEPDTGTFGSPYATKLSREKVCPCTCTCRRKRWFTVYGLQGRGLKGVRMVDEAAFGDDGVKVRTARAWCEPTAAAT